MQTINDPILTFSALQSMQESDYMSQRQLAFFRRQLEDLRDEINQNVLQTSEHLRQRDDTADPVDRATQEEEHSLELRTRDRERKLLKKINAAIQRIENGTFGYCEETGEPIGIARLYARPTATLCIEAQERHERRERQFGE